MQSPRIVMPEVEEEEEEEEEVPETPAGMLSCAS